MSLSDEQIERYSRHIILPEIGGRGQEHLLRSRVAVAGAGSAAATAAIYLAAAGVGGLRMAELPTAESPNLMTSIAALNPECLLDLASVGQRGEAVISGCDVVVAAADRSTMLSLNDACVDARIPLVAAWAEGPRVAIGTFAHAASPCLRCADPEIAPASGLLAAVGEAFAGTIAGLEAVKLILGVGQPLSGRVLLYDGSRGDVSERASTRRADCPACGRGAAQMVDA